MRRNHGDSHRKLILDEASSREQRDAITAISSGQLGGVLFEVFAAAADNRPAPIVAPVVIQSDRERRTATFSLPGVVEHHAEPIKNPVTGEEHRAQIRLPEGFEYQEAEMGNTTWLRVAAGPVKFEHRNTYAQFNAFDWKN